MSHEWTSEGFPDEYVAGFAIPDEDAVGKVTNYLHEKEPVDGVVVEFEDKGTKVHIARSSVHPIIGDMTTLHAVNWSAPDKVPGDYPEYARNFYGFTGPVEQQMNRARLLATALDVPVYLYEEENSDKGNSRFAPVLNAE